MIDGNILLPLSSGLQLAYMMDCYYDKKSIKNLKKTGNNPELLKKLQDDLVNKTVLIKNSIKIKRNLKAQQNMIRKFYESLEEF